MLGHVDFAAHLADRRHGSALEPVRNVVQRFHVGGDVLALAAVAARRAGDERAVLVAQRHRQAVDLRLGGKRDLLRRRGKPQKAADAADEIDHVFLRKRVVEREHRHRVADFGETRRRRRTDPLRQAVLRPQLRKALLDRRITPPQRVVFGIARRSAHRPDSSAGHARRFQPRAAHARPWPAFRSGISTGRFGLSLACHGTGMTWSFTPPRGSDARRRRGLRR